MKNYKRSLAILTAALLAATPLAATGLTALEAVAADLSITDSDKQAHDYNAYQIIKGTLDNGELKNLSWGANINSDALVTALNNADNQAAIGISGEVANSVDAVAKVLSEIDKTSDDYPKQIEKLAKIIASCKTGTATDLDQGDTDATADTFSATGLDTGWYLILDETPAPLATGDATTGVRVKSADILKLTGDTEINAKHSLPTLEKKIVENSSEVDANTAAIGDVVTYVIKTKVPDITGYDKYFFVVDDTLSPGLTYNGDIAVTIKPQTGDAVTLTKDPDTTYTNPYNGDYYIDPPTYNESTGTAIKVVFENAIDVFDDYKAGDDITITYTATVNSNAVITNQGNPNTAKLTYSNDPNTTGNGKDEGHPDEPGSGAPTGETPWDTVKTFTTAIKIKKVDQDGNKLTGAKFKLECNSLNEVKVTSGYKFVEDTNGDYYLLKDGSYTTTEPTATNADLYDTAASGKKFKKTEAEDTYTEKATGSPLAVEALVDSNGYITFTGLKAGEYTLTETQAPNGYNAGTPITITISNSAAPSLEGGPNWTYSGGKNFDTTDNTYLVEVENRYGATLPSTGGIGTKLFYIFGSLLVVGSGVLLITKKRMNTKEN